MAGVPFRRQDNSRKPTPFRCSIVCQIHSPSGEAFLSPALSISAPILLDTLGACPLIWGAGARGEFVAASGTVPMGGLFAAVLSTPFGALIVSCEGSFCAEAMLNVMKSVAATNSDRVFIIRAPVPVPTVNIDEFLGSIRRERQPDSHIAIPRMELWNLPGVYSTNKRWLRKDRPFEEESQSAV